MFFISQGIIQNLKLGSYFGTWRWGESAPEAPRLHVQRLGRSGRIHFLSAAAFFVLSWIALSASSASVNGVTLSTPLVWSSLLAWGHTGPFTGFSLAEGTDGMADPGEENAIIVEFPPPNSNSDSSFILCASKYSITNYQLFNTVLLKISVFLKGSERSTTAAFLRADQKSFMCVTTPKTNLLLFRLWLLFLLHLFAHLLRTHKKKLTKLSKSSNYYDKLGPRNPQEA